VLTHLFPFTIFSEESFIYPNASYHNSQLVDHVKATTKRGHEQALVKLGDRPWNDPGPSRLTRWRNRNKPESEITENLDHNGAEKVLLRAIVLDFQAVANLDTVRSSGFSLFSSSLLFGL
jgi:sodium-independent sulfate anion transporter 11